MAIGDDALAAGMDLVLGTALANTLDTEENKTRDYIAQRTNLVTPITKGGTGSTTAAAARAALGISATNTPSSGSNVQADLDYLSATKADSTALASKASTADVQWVQKGNMSPDIYNRALGGSYRVCYVGADGLLGWVSSSRRYKKNIKPAEVDPAAVLGIELVTFLYKVEIDRGREGITEWGVIAEQVAELGLDWLIDFGQSGEPEGFRYDRLGLALLPVAQHLAAQLEQERGERERLAGRVAAIEAHLDALGGDLDAPTR